MSNTLVYSTRTGQVSATEHANRVAIMHKAGTRRAPRYVICRVCYYEREVGVPCGLPCV